MDTLIDIFNGWQIKIAFSSIVAMFYPFKLSLIILVLVIVLNIGTEISYDIKIKKFNCKKFNKIFIKVTTYFLAIAVVRLFEGSIADIYSTILITQFITSLLTLTEVMNVLKNLTLLGVPIPSGFIKLMISYIKSKLLRDMISESIIIQEYIDDINDIINYQIPTIGSAEMKTLLTIKCEEWLTTIEVINSDFLSPEIYGENDLLYFKMMSIINSTISQIDQKWAETNTNEELIKTMNMLHSAKLNHTLEVVKVICYGTETITNKKRQVISRIIIGMYQSVLDIQKWEKR